MNARDRSQRNALGPSNKGAIAAIAVGLGFVVFVIMRGLTGQAGVTWVVASAIGIALFLVIQAARRRRAR